MKSKRLIWIVSGLIVVFGLAVSAQIFTLFGKLRRSERVVRLLSAEVRRIASVPVSAKLTSGGGRSFTMRLRLRAKDKEIKELSSRLFLRGGDLEEVRKKLESGEKALRLVRTNLKESEKKRSGLRANFKKLNKKLASLKADRAREKTQKEAEVASLAKKNKALLKSLRDLKKAAQKLERRNKKLSRPRIPRELREKIREFGAK